MVNHPGAEMILGAPYILSDSEPAINKVFRSTEKIRLDSSTKNEQRLFRAAEIAPIRQYKQRQTKAELCHLVENFR